MSYTVGIDYGTNSCRAVVVDTATGAELGTSVFNYPTGEEGIIVDAKDHNLARQNPADYVAGLEATVTAALAEAEGVEGFERSKVVGLGVDGTGSSPIPVDGNFVPLAMRAEFAGNPNAHCWLWKDHTGAEEARLITEKAAEMRPEYLAKIGGVYSSEWFWSKIWRCLKVDEEVFDAAESWVELSDFVPGVLCGAKSPGEVARGICMAGHKAMYCDEWGGLPDEEFLRALDPKLAGLRGRLFEKAQDASEKAGTLGADWAEKLGLSEGIAVAIGEMDVHYGAIGCGVDEGTLVKVIGTSTCDCGVVSAENEVADIPGICGIVKGAILPGYFGMEAGQSAVGDIFKWWVERCCEGSPELHGELTGQASAMVPGQSGLLALDWNNGNRTILVDPLLTGALVGQTLYTTRAEIYRALIEATAFGARAIIERLTDYGVPVERVVCAGGIAEKNPMLMQIYADVTGCEMRVSSSSQTCALGSAVGAAVAAGVYGDFRSAQDAMTSLKEVSYKPNAEAKAVYDRLFGLYMQLHDAMGGVTENANLGGVMKELLEIKKEANA
ncbi:MAG: ribulokinase [Verrucomicrobiota bacterium]